VSTPGPEDPYARLDELIRIRDDFEAETSRQPPANRPGSRRAGLGEDLARIRAETEEEVLRLLRSGITPAQVRAHLDRTDRTRPGYTRPPPRPRPGREPCHRTR
jgi:hypothetical protein